MLQYFPITEKLSGTVLVKITVINQMASNITLNSQLIKVLCGGTGDLSSILALLISKYPSSGWTSSILSTLLVKGVKEGRFVQVTTSPQRWQVRQNMAFVFPSNQVYQNLCTGILKRYDCL